MDNVSLLTLRTQAKERSNQERSRFIKDTTWNLWINDSIKRLFKMLVDLDQDFYTISADVAVTSDRIDLPDDFWKLIDITYTRNGRAHSMKKWGFKDRHRLQTDTGNNADFTYRVVKNEVIFLPTPNAQTITLWYAPIPPVLVDDVDETDVFCGFEQWVILDVAIKAMAKEESDTRDLEKERAALEADMKLSAITRDGANPERVTDIHETPEIVNITGASY